MAGDISTGRLVEADGLRRGRLWVDAGPNGASDIGRPLARLEERHRMERTETEFPDLADGGPAIDPRTRAVVVDLEVKPVTVTKQAGGFCRRNEARAQGHRGFTWGFAVDDIGRIA
jgi:hypothetical protein